MADRKLHLMTGLDLAFKFLRQTLGIGRHKMAFAGNDNIPVDPLVPRDDGVNSFPGTALSRS